MKQKSKVRISYNNRISFINILSIRSNMDDGYNDSMIHAECLLGERHIPNVGGNMSMHRAIFLTKEELELKKYKGRTEYGLFGLELQLKRLMRLNVHILKNQMSN